MSLINKMLQDLDARGTPAADAFPSSVKPVAPERRARALPLDGVWRGAAIAGAVGVTAAVVAALGWFGWHHWHAAGPARSASSAPVVKPALALARPAQAMGGAIAPAPPAASAPAQVAPAGAVSAPAHVERGPQADAPAVDGRDAAARHTRASAQAREPDPAFGSERPARAAAGASDAHRKSIAPLEPDSVEAREARHAAAIELATRDARLARLARLSAPAAASAASAASAPAAPAAAKARHAAANDKPRDPAAAEGREESSFQRAENEYRRALASLQDGRMSDTIAALQTALRIDPGHDAARQTLVGLLVEANRQDEAIRELQLGLAQDPRQPALAMLLARLQIERGGSGIEALQRSLPYAGNQPDYHAFLAGALQRQGRQREAAEQYQQALRSAPGNGVWWMGLGISLQADKRNADALDAFQRARASANLGPDLQAFVERRLQQLAR